MQVICISRGTLGRGKDLAEVTAKKLDFACLSREELVEAAVKEGIQVGKLEMAMLKPQAFSERLALEREHYQAFCTAYLCDRAVSGDLVYHGRTGHLLLPGVSHVLRVRVVSDQEHRIRAVMNQMGIERNKARRYIEEVDEDRKRWAKSMYGVSLDEVINYDFIVNLEQMSLENAASALLGVAQLPDFQMTPASKKAVLNLQLGARVRLELARDERTCGATFKVRADAGTVTVSYLPQDSKVAEFIPEVLQPVVGVGEVRITMAMTNILWIQQEFQPHSETYEKVVEIARKWNAAVELMRLAPEEQIPSLQQQGVTDPTRAMASVVRKEYDGGIEDDTADVSGNDGGLKPTLDELAMVGRSGGGRSVYGDHHQLIELLDRHIPYTLVVIGNVFLAKGHAAKLRATRDLRSFLSDRIKAPVVTADELGSQYLFGKRDITRTVVFAALALAMYWLVFAHQEPILGFLAHSGWYAEAVEGTFLARFSWLPKVIVSAAVFLVIPVVAYTYGSVTSAILKLMKME
jgi:cytidylate kinase